GGCTVQVRVGVRCLLGRDRPGLALDLAIDVELPAALGTEAAVDHRLGEGLYDLGLDLDTTLRARHLAAMLVPLVLRLALFGVGLHIGDEPGGSRVATDDRDDDGGRVGAV